MTYSDLAHEGTTDMTWTAACSNSLMETPRMTILCTLVIYEIGGGSSVLNFRVMFISLELFLFSMKLLLKAHSAICVRVRRRLCPCMQIPLLYRPQMRCVNHKL